MPIILRQAARPPPNSPPGSPPAPVLLPAGTYLGYLAAWRADLAAPMRGGAPPVERVEVVLTILRPPAYAGQRVVRRYYLDGAGSADFALLLRTLLPPAY